MVFNLDIELLAGSMGDNGAFIIIALIAGQLSFLDRMLSSFGNVRKSRSEGRAYLPDWEKTSCDLHQFLLAELTLI
jgi:hypothetical protein